MGKKKLPASTTVTTVPVIDPETVSQANRERNRKAAEIEWDKAITAANAEYGAASNGAWLRYVSGLKADTTKPGDPLWGTERDYDRQYDLDRANAVKRFNVVTDAANKKLVRGEAD